MYPILIDVTRLLYRRIIGRFPTGIDRVSLEYLRHYGNRARAVVSLNRFHAIFSRNDSASVFEMLLEQPARITSAAKRSLARAFIWSWINRSGINNAYLINTHHIGLEKKDYASAWHRLGARPVFFIHDLIPLTHPEYLRPGEQMRHHARIVNALTFAHRIVVNSQDTLNALENFSKMSKLALPPTLVAPLAARLPTLDISPRLIEEPYFVMLGTLEPRKNHWMLLQLWRRLIEKQGAAAPKLVLIGQRGWECENVVDLLERCEALRGFVIERTRCTDQELVAYLRHAQALLFPSFVEGYGLPIVEALSQGVPVIASDLPVFREIAGGVPEYADPLDGKHWIELISDYAKTESPLRKAQRARMAGFRATTWSDHFETVDAFLERPDINVTAEDPSAVGSKRRLNG